MVLVGNVDHGVAGALQQHLAAHLALLVVAAQHGRAEHILAGGDLPHKIVAVQGVQNTVYSAFVQRKALTDLPEGQGGVQVVKAIENVDGALNGLDDFSGAGLFHGGYLLAGRPGGFLFL